MELWWFPVSRNPKERAIGGCFLRNFLAHRIREFPAKIMTWDGIAKVLLPQHERDESQVHPCTVCVLMSSMTTISVSVFINIKAFSSHLLAIYSTPKYR
jgi:hypothetical protein